MAHTFSEMDFSCPVCYETFQDPVVLHCSHSVCKVCLQTFWNTKGSRDCPVCRTVSPIADPPLNLALKNLCLTFSKESIQKPVCSQHTEKLKLFCLDDQIPVCLVCQTSKKHTNHRFSPIDEAATDCKEILKTALQPLKKKLETFKACELNWNKTAEHIKSQSQNTENKIKEEFKKLHQFLHDEEAHRLDALTKEEVQKSKVMKNKIEKLNQEILSLTDTIRSIEEEMNDEDVSFLQKYKTTLARTHCTMQQPEEPCAVLIDVAQHLSNLNFQVWEKMQQIVQYRPINLDPNTACPFLILSDDLTSVRLSNKDQQLPDNPERFDEYYCTMGSVGFDSGSHYWDVEVEDCTAWDIGVMTESAHRKGEIYTRSGGWFVWYNDGKYKASSTPHTQISLKIEWKLKRIRVLLDWEKGMLSFSDPLTNINLYTFNHRFTEKLMPLLGLGCESSALKILPVQCFVKVNTNS